MNNNQRIIAQQLLMEKIIVQSWGISNIKLIEDGVCFDVCGLKYKGPIKISNSTRECEIRIGSKQIVTTIDCIVNVLDREIEVTNNYASDLDKWLFYKKNRM